MWRSEQHWWERLDGYRRRTQGRWLEMAGRLTGVSGGLKKREREQIATRLRVATMTVLSGARRWGRSWQNRGATIVAVLVALACSAPLGDRMGAAGAVSDLWGPPRPRLVARWEHDRLRLLDPKNESVVAAEVDPEIRFGQPRIPGTGIPTAIIYERWLAGEAAAQLAAVYERPVAEVTSAISYEESSRAA